MRKSAFFLLYSLSSIIVQAQLTGKITADRFIIRSSSAAYQRGGGDIQGTPYWNDNFFEGEVFAYKSHYDEVLMRYNIYDDNIEFQQNGSVLILEPDIRLSKVIIGQTLTLVVAKFEYKREVQLGFLEQLDSGKISLYAKKVVSFKDKSEPQPLEYQGKPASYTRLKDIYYYRIGNEGISKLENVKRFIESIPDNRDVLNSFAKKEKTSIERDDLIKLVQYYNSL